MLNFYLFAAAMVLAAYIAFTHGGPAERQAALAMGAAFGMSVWVQGWYPTGLNIGILLVDAALLAVLGWIAIRGRAFWPVWAAGMQAAMLLVHAAAAVLPHLRPATYVETMAIWSYGIVFSLIAGCLFERRDIRV